MTSHRPGGGPWIGIISDDLTGASGAAARLASRGIRSRVVWDLEAGWEQCDAVVADTRGRDCPAGAVTRAAAWGRAFQQADASRLEMRVDTTLRGRPADELDGFLLGLALVRPILLAVTAHPSAGRTTVDGVQLIQNLGGQRASIEVAPALFGSRPARVIPHTEVAQGSESIMQHVSSGIDEGIDAFVVDCIAESDLRAAASAVEGLDPLDGQVVTISSGAWLRYYPSDSAHSYVLCVVASPTEANRAQLQALIGGRAGVQLAKPEEVISNPGALLSAEPTVVVIETLTKGIGKDPTQTAAEAVYQLLSESMSGMHRCSGLVVSGGRAAGAVADRLGARCIDVSTEVEPLCSFGYLVGGPFDGLCMVTKGGQIGHEQTLGHLVEAAARRIATRNENQTDDRNG